MDKKEKRQNNNGSEWECEKEGIEKVWFAVEYKSNVIDAPW